MFILLVLVSMRDNSSRCTHTDLPPIIPLVHHQHRINTASTVSTLVPLVPLPYLMVKDHKFIPRVRPAHHTPTPLSDIPTV